MEPTSPQLEDGYTRIANELLEALSSLQCPASVFRITLLVIRETYGYNRKTAAVSREHMAEITGWGLGRVKQAVCEAVAWNVLVRNGRELGVQKDHSKWARPEVRTAGFRKDALSQLREGRPTQKGKDALPETKDGSGRTPYPKGEGRPTRSDLELDGLKGKDALPENGKDALPDKTSKTKDRTSKTTPSPKPGPANSPLAQLVQDTWEAFGFEGSPPSKKPAAYGGAMRLMDGKARVIRDELIPWIEEHQPAPEDGDSDAGFFLATLKEKLACPPGVGWRQGTSEATGTAKKPIREHDFENMILPRGATRESV